MDEADDADDRKAAIIDLIVQAKPAPSAELRTELEAMKFSALRKRAQAAGVAQADLEAADDTDDSKATVIGLILDYQELASAAPPCTAG